MGKKYFCTSDIHGYFDIFHDALIKAGFDEENPDHILIICGDIFDRGNQPLEIYNYLRGLPKERRVLVRGNHELLLQEMVERGQPLSHDIHNGTYYTLYNFIGTTYQEEKHKEIEKWTMLPRYDTMEYQQMTAKLKADSDKLHHHLFHNRQLKSVLSWIKSKEWVNYFELGPYIFVHAALPVATKAVREPNLFDDDQEYPPEWSELDIPTDWRTANRIYWNQAVWECPYQFYLNFRDSEELKDRILVAGHWHTSDFWNRLENKKYSLYEFNPIFISEKYPGIIGLDACTTATKGCNILVINEDMTLEPHNHRDYIIETVTEDKI